MSPKLHVFHFPDNFTPQVSTMCEKTLKLSKNPGFCKDLVLIRAHSLAKCTQSESVDVMSCTMLLGMHSFSCIYLFHSTESGSGAWMENMRRN